MPITASGLATGLDVESIVTSLVNSERGPLNLLTAQKTAVQSQVSAFGTLKSSLSTFQTAISALATSSKFDVQATKLSDSTSFTATANGKASNTDYTVKVNQLAQNHKIASSGFATTDTVIGTGSLTIEFGTFVPAVTTVPTAPASFTPNASVTPTSITIDSSNNTLSGIRDAINAANAGVTASIINDGSTNGNRLVITSKSTGETNSVKITVADTTDGSNTDASGLSRLAYDPMLAAGSGNNLTQLQAAQNALINVDGIDITKPSNTITDALQGVTFNLLKVSTSSINMNISTDSAAIETSVNAFVKAYNDLNTTLTNLTKYDAATNTASPLLGDSTTRSIINQIKNTMVKTLTTGNSLNTLSQIGVAFQRDGTLAVDSTKLKAAITDKPTEIAALFATTAKSTDPQVTFVSSTSKTQAGTYAVNMTQIGSATVNAAGTINGVAANGIESNLVGVTGDASEGLNLRITGTTLGSRGTVTVSIGFAAQLNSIMTEIMKSDGILTAKTNGLNSSITRITKQQEAQNDRLEQIEKRYREQFTRLESTISSLNSTSTFLSQQLAAISANS